jgi:hypothetical protein
MGIASVELYYWRKAHRSVSGGNCPYIVEHDSTIVSVTNSVPLTVGWRGRHSRRLVDERTRLASKRRWEWPRNCCAESLSNALLIEQGTAPPCRRKEGTRIPHRACFAPPPPEAGGVACGILDYRKSWSSRVQWAIISLG